MPSSNPLGKYVDPAAAFGVARGNNRVNSSGAPLNSQQSRTSLFYSNIVPAGQTLQIPSAGTQFYLTVCTLPIQIRPSGGVFNSYSQGKGLQLLDINAFSLLEIKNTNSVAVVFQIFVGFDGYIDNTLILNQSSGQADIVYATYPVVNAANSVTITDLSGTEILDSNGVSFYALNRVAILAFNADGAAVYDIQNTAANKTMALLQPLQALRLDWAGNFKIVEGGPLNIIVSEIYSAIPKIPPGA